MIAPITGTANIDKVLTEGDVILGFSAPWCGYCRRLRPMVEKLSGEIETLFMALMLMKMRKLRSDMK